MWRSVMISTSAVFEKKRLSIVALTALLLLSAILYISLRDDSHTIDSSQLEILLSKNLIERVEIKEPYLYISTKRHRYKIASSVVDMRSLAKRYPIEYRDEYLGRVVVLTILLLMAFVLYFILRRRLRNARIFESVPELEKEEPANGVQRASIQAIRSDVTFSDLAGMNEAKEELAEIIDFFENPSRYLAMDIRVPKGVLLAGPPGVGKTLLAKAVAGEAGVPFFYRSGADIVELYVGVGARRVREIFRAAKMSAPSIIFIDEIDAIGRRRGERGNDEREATLNQLLTEMDGFESDSGVVVIAATNRMEMLDEALLRPGRFDRRVHISLPDREERVAILSLYLKKKSCDADIGRIASKTVGFSSAALSTLVNEAALHALRRGSERISDEDFDAVSEKVISGRRKIVSFSEKEREIQAVYQSGKVLAATWLDIPYEKIGLVTTLMREEEREILSRADYFNRIMFHLSGRAATRLVFDEFYDCVEEDLHMAKTIAHKMLSDYGMSQDIFATDTQMKQLLEDAQAQVESLLGKLSEARKSISAYLLANENITEEDARGILHEIF